MGSSAIYFNYGGKTITQDLNKFSTAGVTWHQGLYGPADTPLKATNCDKPQLRKLVYGVLLPKLDEASARGNLFEKMFGIMPFGQAQLDDDVQLPLFQLTKKSWVRKDGEGIWTATCILFNNEKHFFAVSKWNRTSAFFLQHRG